MLHILINEYSKIIAKYKKYEKYYDSFNINGKNNIIRQIADSLKIKARPIIDNIHREMNDVELFNNIKKLYIRLSDILPEITKIINQNAISKSYLDVYDLRDK